MNPNNALPHRVMLIDNEPDSKSAIRKRLLDAGCDLVHHLAPNEAIEKIARQVQPDAIIIDVPSPHAPLLKAVANIHAATPLPIVLFTEDEEEHTIHDAIEAGVTAYIVDSLQRRKVRPILNTAMARFKKTHKLEQELESTRERLNERKQVERAKGILMTQRKLSESDAYQLLRKTAMSQNKRMGEIADSIITAHDMLAP